MSSIERNDRVVVPVTTAEKKRWKRVAQMAGLGSLAPHVRIKMNDEAERVLGVAPKAVGRPPGSVAQPAPEPPVDKPLRQWPSRRKKD